MNYVTRFWSKVDERGPDECWPWLSNVSRLGYGYFKLNNRSLLAHRLAYEMVVGEIPLGLELDHTCRNRLCQNPAHLEPVTHAENMRRAAEARVAYLCGHPVTEANSYVDNRGSRTCLECRRRKMRENARRYRAAKR